MNVTIKFFFTMGIAVMGLGGMAQTPPDLPYMWVTKGHDMADRNKFMQRGYPTSNSLSKYEILNAIVPSQPITYVYPVRSIDSLIVHVKKDDIKYNADGVRLHFAAYNPKTAPNGVPMGSTKDKQVIFIFSGSFGNKKKDVPIYYVISPEDYQLYQISDSVMSDWCNYYYSNEDNATGLVSTIQPNSPDDNQYQYDGVPSDTRSLFYEMENFTGFLQDERSYQDTHPEANPSRIKIDSIGLFFAVYPDTGIGDNPYGDPPKWYKDRLFVLFELMRSGKIFYFEDGANFCERGGATCNGNVVAFREKRKFVNLFHLRPEFLFGGDNGQLCPPNCPCLTPPCK